MLRVRPSLLHSPLKPNCRYGSSANQKKVIAIRREDQSIWERRLVEQSNKIVEYK